ncbi:MAG TPA: ADOP family duplicated permease [Vicinamibacterales bacterium]|nr:ADOP family duplicated permease [Vicinamibacterales bacterium]
MRITDSLLLDVRHARRALRATPGFTIAATFTLALGLGSAITIFNLANAALFKPVPYPDPDRLVALTMEGRPSAFSGAQFLALRDRVSQLDAMAARSGTSSFNLLTDRAAVNVTALRVTQDYFRVHGVAPTGRGFTEAELLTGGPEAVVISDDLWSRVFERRADAIGSTIRLGTTAYLVVGIMPAGFRTIPAADIALPLRTTTRDTGRNYTILGRLRTDATASGAQVDLDQWRIDIIRERPGINERSVPRFSWASYRDVLGQGFRQPLFVLLASVGVLLLIACVNVASLNIARALARQREIATRAALGAPFGRLLRHLCVESLLVAGTSGIVGVLLAQTGTTLLLSLVSEDLSREFLSGAATTPDWRVWIAAGAMTLTTGLFFGIAPAVILLRLDARQTLSEGRRATEGRHTARLRRTLAVAEVALAVVLLVGAGLLIRTFVNLMQVEKGFNPERVVLGWMSLQGTSAETAGTRAVLFDQALERIRELPGVRLAAISNQVPIERGLNLTLLPPRGARITTPRAVDWRYITPDYFAVFEIAIRAGRAFDTSDSAAGRPVVIVNEAFARSYFGRLDVTGETIQLDPTFMDEPREIVGVAADVKARSGAGFVTTIGINSLTDPVAPAIFVPAAQASDAAVRGANRFFNMKWIVKADAAAGGQLETGIREAVRAVDPTLPFIRFEPMTTVIANDVALQRLLTVLLASFAGLAMLLAAVGLFGLIAYSASQRRREIGVRMAVGATAVGVGRLFMMEGLFIALLGLGAGTLGAIATTRVLTSRLFGVTPLDVPTFVATAVALVVVATCAASLPALQAARTDPIAALRGD